jgi:glycosyltransferase involved in cell wall biosynthesis
MPHCSLEIYNAVNDLLVNLEKRKILSDNAYEMVQKYDWEHIGQKYLDVYNGL